MSGHLKNTVEDELARAYIATPDLAGWKALELSHPELMTAVSAKGSRKGFTKGLANVS